MNIFFSNLFGLSKLEARIAELVLINKQLIDDNSKYEDALTKKYVLNINETSEKLVELEKVYNQKQKKLLAVEEQSKQLDSDVQKSKQKIEIVEQYTETVEFYKKEKAKYTKKFKLLEQKSERLKLSITQLKEEEKSVEKIVYEGKKSLVTQIHQSDNLKVLIQDMEIKAKQAEKKVKSAEKYEQTYETYLQQKAIYDEKSAKVSREINKLKNIEEEYKTKYENLIHVEKLTKQLISQSEQLNIDINKQLEAKDKFTLSKEEYETEANKYILQREELIKEKNTLEKDLVDLKNKLKSVNGEVIAQDKNIDKKKCEFNKQLHSIVKLREIQSQLEPIILKIKQELQPLQKMQAEINDKIIELNEQYKTKKTQLNSISNQIITKVKDCETLKKNIHTHKKKFNILHDKYGHECLFAIVEADLKDGYISEWIPELYKRLYRYDSNRAKKLLLEIMARHPQPEVFEFSEDPLSLVVDGTPVEHLFAAMASQINTSDKLQQFVNVWENYLGMESQK